MRKRNFRHTALAILVLTVCLFSPACTIFLPLVPSPENDPSGFTGLNVVLSCLMGGTYGTELVPLYEQHHFEQTRVGPPALVPVDSTPPPGQPTISPVGQGATTSSASNGSSTAGALGLRPSIGAAATIVRTLYMPDGFTKSILVIDGNTTLETGKIAQAGQPGDVVLSPDHSTLYAAVFPPSGSTTGSIAVISTASQTITRTISLPDAYPQWLAISPDGATLWVTNSVGTYSSAGGTNSVLAIDIASGTVRATLQPPVFNGGRPVISPDGLTVYVPVNSGFQTIDTTTLQADYLIYVPVALVSAPPPHAVFSPDGRYLYAPNYSSVSIIDAGTGRQAGSISLPNSAAYITDLLIIGGGSGLLVADANSGNLYNINLATNTVFATTPPPSGVTPGKGSIQLLQLQ
jgi:DNA-binding beta-propeller fold protein YncE